MFSYIYKKGDMFKQEYYIRASEIFGCSIGVANTITWRTKEESRSEFSAEEFRKLDDEIQINRIILDAIEENGYEALRRGVLRGEKEARKGTKSVTIWKRIYGGSKSKF